LNRARIFILLLLILSNPSFTQSIKLCEVKIDSIDSGILLQNKRLLIPASIQSSSIYGLMDNFYSNGFPEASYILSATDSNCKFTVYPGKQYKWVSLDKGNLPAEILDRLKFDSDAFNDRIFDFRKLTEFFQKVISWSENNGYPFGSVRIKRIRILDQGIEASLDYNPGPLIEFDTISVTGTNKIKKKFLYAYLQIWPGHVYDKSKVKIIPGLINILPGLESGLEPEEYFSNGKCSIRLSLKDKNASSFNGYIGFMPNEVTPGKILLTGQINLRLNNLFKSGKSFGLNWDRPNLLSQSLNIRYYHPCLFNSLLNGSVQGIIFKQDTTFINEGLTLGLDVRKADLGKIGMEINYFSSRVLQKEIPVNTDNSNLANLNIIYYGLSYINSHLDNPDFPLSGWETSISLKTGIKRTEPFVAADSTGTEATPLNTMQIRILAAFTKYTKINNTSTVLARLNSGIINDKNIFLNDMYRLGGLASIRGFNENYFYSSKYLYGNIEYRLLIEKKSYLLFFTDLGLIYNDFNHPAELNYPVSAGGGFSLGTPLGNLEILIGMGKDNNQPFGLRYSKFHIGYSSRF
jgi:outer membrane protein assembly factor BamA